MTTIDFLQTKRNDVFKDFLITTGPNVSAWFPAGLILDLEQLLGRHIEVVTESGLNPLLRDQVLTEAITL